VPFCYHSISHLNLRFLGRGYFLIGLALSLSLFFLFFLNFCFPLKLDTNSTRHDLTQTQTNFSPIKFPNDLGLRNEKSDHQFPTSEVVSTPSQKSSEPTPKQFNHSNQPNSTPSIERSDRMVETKLHSSSQVPDHPQFIRSNKAILNSSSGYLQEGASMEVETYLEIRIPENAPLPAVVAAALDAAATDSTIKTLAGSKANPLDDILNNFLNQAEQSAESAQQLHNAAEAAESADERFQTLYGTEAFMKYSVEAARLKFQEKLQSMDR